MDYRPTNRLRELKPQNTLRTMKAIDFAIIAAVLGCAFFAYTGRRLEAALLLVAVILIASWRFWDRSKEKDLLEGGGDVLPDPRSRGERRDFYAEHSEHSEPGD
jgi:hypothetical protein